MYREQPPCEREDCRQSYTGLLESYNDMQTKNQELAAIAKQWLRRLQWTGLVASLVVLALCFGIFAQDAALRHECERRVDRQAGYCRSCDERLDNMRASYLRQAEAELECSRKYVVALGPPRDVCPDCANEDTSP